MKKTKISASFIKSTLYLAIRTIIPGAILLGLFFFLYWMSVVSHNSGLIGFGILGIFLFIIIGLLMGYILSIASNGISSLIFISSNNASWIVKQIDNDTYLIEQNNSNDSSYLLLVYVLLSPIISILFFLLFIIGFIRILLSKNIRIIYTENFSDLCEILKEKFKFIIIIFSICSVVLIPITIYTRSVQIENNIDIFAQFKTPPKKNITCRQ